MTTEGDSGHTRPYHIYYANEAPLAIDSASFRKLEPSLIRKIMYCSDWNELSEMFKLKPASMCVNAKHFKDQSCIEIISMLETLARLVGCDKNMSITLGINTDTPYKLVKEAQKCRITGIVPASSDFGVEETMKGLDAQWSEKSYWPKAILDKLPGAKKPKVVNPKKEIALTGRQQQIFDILTKNGSSNKHIAKLLGISESTVKLHITHIFKKYGVRNRTQLAVFSKV